MTKNVVKVTCSPAYKSSNGQPIHLHIPGDTPIHLHVNQKTQVSRLPESGNVKLTDIGPYQAPWVPPPAKTSSGRFSCDPARRVTIKPDRRKHRSRSAESFSENLNKVSPAELNEVESDKEVHIECPKECISCKTISNEEQLLHTSDQLKDTPKLCTHIYGNSRLFEGDKLATNEASFCTSSLLDEWIKDLDNAVSRVAKSARNIVDCIEQVAYEGRRVDSHDMLRLVQPRDELLLQTEIAGRAGRELCRWASSVQQQQNEILANRLSQTQTREANLTAEVKRLTEKLDRMEIDLEVAQKQLNEQQNESLKYNTVHESMESVKGHLQRQLRQRDSECSRLSIQVRNLEARLAEQQAQNQVRLETAEANLERMRETKEALKRAAKSQKRRADEAEEAFREISHKLATQESIIAGFRAELENSNLRSRSRSRERQLHDDMIGGGGGVFDSNGLTNANKPSVYTDSDKDLREENIRLREVALKCEQRLHTAEEELERLRTNLSNCETLLYDYHGDAATQANRLHTLNERLKKTEADRERSQIQLDDVERRLFEAENRNRVLESALQMQEAKKSDDRTKSSTPIHKTTLSSPSKTLGKHQQQQPSNLNTDDHSSQNIKLNIDSDTSKTLKDRQTKTTTIHTTTTTATTTNNNNNASDDLIQELRRELTEAQNEKKQIENRTEIRLQDLRAQLNQADATNRSLQAYLTFLKRSYASVFQTDDMLLINPVLFNQNNYPGKRTLATKKQLPENIITTNTTTTTATNYNYENSTGRVTTGRECVSGQ
uniref:Myosin_tail_1 domain-containing protein n=1 Tax=Trichobilharzia regenti TaxID=157069 RepID=A0AA85IZX2_TRIRE|nr:unnamed protein product [Trichobilharzia regenti]